MSNCKIDQNNNEVLETASEMIKATKDTLIDCLKKKLLDAPIYVDSTAEVASGTWREVGIKLGEELYILQETDRRYCLGTTQEIYSVLGWIDKSDIVPREITNEDILNAIKEGFKNLQETILMCHGVKLREYESSKNRANQIIGIVNERY